MKKYSNQLQPFLLALISFVLVDSVLFAQTYYEDFETLTKISYSSETITLNGVEWNFTGANAGNTPTDFFVDAKSARLAGTNKVASNSDTSKLEMLNNKPGGIGDISFLYKKYGNDVQKDWAVQWSSNGISWQTIDTIRPVDTIILYSHSLNQANARIRIYSLRFATGSANISRFNIDNLLLTNYADSISVPNIILKEPLGNNISLSTNTLSITYDIPVQAGSGTITLHKVNGTNQDFLVPSSKVIINGEHVKVNGIKLENASEYYVTMGAGLFKSLRGNLITEPIVSTTAWIFSTIDTSRAIPMKKLEETFTNCDNNSNMMGAFRQFSVTGSKTWKCSSYGYTDSNAVFINGGYATGTSEENEDWLISKAPFNFSEMMNPVLSLWEKARFEGNVRRDILVSTDYAGHGDPHLASWTSLNVSQLNTVPTPTNIWKQINNINLNDYKAIPFYLAFTYECGSAGAWEIAYDDIMVQESTSISKKSKGTLNVKVIGESTFSNINLSVFSEISAKVRVQIFDMTGRTLHTEFLTTKAGRNVYKLSNLHLTAGFYVIHVQSNEQFEVVKAVVK